MQQSCLSSSGLGFGSDRFGPSPSRSQRRQTVANVVKTFGESSRRLTGHWRVASFEALDELRYEDCEADGRLFAGSSCGAALAAAIRFT